MGVSIIILVCFDTSSRRRNTLLLSVYILTHFSTALSSHVNQVVCAYISNRISEDSSVALYGMLSKFDLYLNRQWCPFTGFLSSFLCFSLIISVSTKIIIILFKLGKWRKLICPSRPRVKITKNCIILLARLRFVLKKYTSREQSLPLGAQDICYNKWIITDVFCSTRIISALKIFDNYKIFFIQWVESSNFQAWSRQKEKKCNVRRE